jgi:hypothetical protein
MNWTGSVRRHAWEAEHATSYRMPGFVIGGTAQPSAGGGCDFLIIDIVRILRAKIFSGTHLQAPDK